MTSSNPRSGAALRQCAEDQLHAGAIIPSDALSRDEVALLVHNLQVHQIELEMQNEELRRSQTELDIARARYFNLYDLAPVGYCTISEQGVILEANFTAATLLGVTRGALVKQPISRFICKEDQDIFYRHRKLLAETDEPQSYELRMVKQDGTQFWAHQAAVAAQDIDGAPVYRIVLRDITARKEMEARLRASEEKYRAVFESAAIGIEKLDQQGHFLSGNAKLAEILGMTIQEIHAMTYAQITYPDDLLREQPLLAQLLAGEQLSYTIEKRYVHKDGHPVWVRVTSSLSREAPQRNLILIIEDITARKHIEAELRQTTAELVSSNKELERFAYVASHDLLEPLRAVSGYVSLVKRRMEDRLDTRALQHIDGAIQGTERMRQLITDLLALSRVGTQEQLVPVDLNSVFKQTMQTLSTSILETAAQISHDPLPTLTADAGQLGQLLQNLMSNAIKFRADRPLRIHLGVERRDDGWQFVMRDNGIGIDPQYAHRIFQLFQRLHTRTEYPGTGIGLAICQKIITRLGGTIWVESQPGQGASFFFTIPHQGVSVY